MKALRPLSLFERGWIIALVGMAASSPASPLQHPKRLVSAYGVDLAPLFKWWTKHEGPRPLASWVHVSGSIVGINALQRDYEQLPVYDHGSVLK